MRGNSITTALATVALGGALAAALAGCATTTTGAATAPTGHATVRTMSKAEEVKADAFEAVMDATYPHRSPLVSYSGELQHGDPGGIMGSGSGVAPGSYVMTLACTGAETLTFELRLPGQTVTSHQVTCGTPTTVGVTTTQPGSTGFGVRAVTAAHPDAYFFAGFAKA
ncbi:hypothetical protein [Frondihabitans australicus]|uniref:Lipoprotein n=1 Tax=Frondihabitans australicus TaxID=386892 RepID=A0A495IEX7_9MICO|nr:hypothetical protein [Frondihabitans australicus]RKR73566.1 hypothetical protein C8E83_0659 [Frondihabitans australicus]